MKRVDMPRRAPDHVVFRAEVSSARPPGDYTARMMPRLAGVAIPLEAPHILWQR
jgi:starch phosphorylase